MKSRDDFRYEGKPTTKSTLFAVSKDERDAKEDTGKSMENALCTLQYACLKESVSQAARQLLKSVENSIE